MSSQIIGIFDSTGAGVTGLDATTVKFRWCKKVSDDTVIVAAGTTISAAGGTLVERDYGFYKLTLTVTEDTDFYVYQTATPANFAVGYLSLSDGDVASQANIGTAGAGLTAIGDARIANLDATISSRLAPAGTLATVTNLTNAPGAGDFTSTMKTSLNAATPASVQNISAQTGDAYALIGTAGAGLTALGDARIVNLDAAISSRVATSGYIAPDNTGIASILTAINDGTHGLAALLTAIGTRMATFTYTAPDNASITSILADVESVTYGLAAIKTTLGLIPTTPLLSGDTRLPATLIASQADVAVVYADTQDLRAKIDPQTGAWGASTSGAYLIHIQTTIAGSDPPVPIPDALITLLNADGSVLLDSRKADSMGQASFPRDNGTYIVRHVLAGYSFDDDTAIVNNADVDHICEGTPLVLPANPDPDVQLVYFPDTVAGQIVRAYPTSGQLTSQTLVDKQRTEGLTIAGTTGVSLALLRGVEYTVQVVGWGELTFTVTTASERYFAQYVAESGGV